MTRTELLIILQEETDGFKEQSRLRDDVLDAMEQAYIKGKNEQLTIPDVVGQSEQLKKFLYYVANASAYTDRNKMNREAEELLNKLF